MDDIHVVAAILTLALHSAEQSERRKRVRSTGRTYGRTIAISCKNWKNRITQLTRTESIQIDRYSDTTSQ